MQENNMNNQQQLFVFVFLSSLLATVFGYGFGVGNHSEQLPIIMRAMDPGFLKLDAYVNASAAFGPYSYYAHLVAILAKPFGLPVVFFMLTWLSNLGIAFFTGLSTQELFREKKYAAFFAIIAVFCCKTFWLGYSNILYRNFLEPMNLALPLAMFGFYTMLKNRPLWITLACGLAAVFHASFALQSGAIFLIILFVEIFLFQRTSHQPGLKRNLTIAIGGFIGISALFLFPYQQQASIPDAVFIQILAYFRYPHHFLASTFPIEQFLQAAFFLLAVGFTWLNAAKLLPSLKEQNRKLISLGLILLSLALAGYVFVELIPTRLITNAQTFRLMIWIKWLGLIFLGGWIGSLRSKESEEENIKHLSSWTFVLGLITPLSMVLTAAMDRVYGWLWKKSRSKALRVLQSLTPFVLILSTLIYEIDARNTLLLIALLLLISMQDAFPKTWQINLGSAGLVTILLLVYLRIIPIPGLDAYPVFDKPKFTLEEHTSEKMLVARFIKENTQADALFFTHPSFDELRYVGERALLFSFESFPFQDQAMQDWVQTLLDCYGKPASTGFEAVPEMRDAFTALNDDDLVRLQQKYGFTHAVLYSSMPTRFPVLFQSETYKVITIP